MPLTSALHSFLGRLAATLAALSANIVIAQDATLDSLGFLPGHVRSEARGVSADGTSVVGKSADNAGGQYVFGLDPSERGFVWSQKGGMTRLEGLLSDNSRNVANAISTDGLVIVGEALDESGFRVPVQWSNQQIARLQLPANSTGRDGLLGRAVSVSGDGSTILGLTLVGTPSSQPQLINVRWRDGLPSLDLGDQIPASTLLQPALAQDGTVALFSLGPRDIFRWQPDTGAVQLRLAPSARREISDDCECDPTIGGIALSGDGARIVGTTGRVGRPPRTLRWEGFADGGITTQSLGSRAPLARAVTTRTGSLIAGMEDRFFQQPTDDGAVVIAPFGVLSLRALLAAQGANVSSFASLTNVTAISPDGQWLVGSGRSTASGYPEAFRAKLILHADGEPQVATETIVPDDGMPFDRLRWSVRDLLVVVESRPVLHPAVPWAAESGEPRIEGASIVLDLPKTTEHRFYRLRRVE